jgi:hypothetical protein
MPTQSDEAEIVNSISYIPVAEDRLSSLKMETSKDSTLQDLIDIILKGWPEDKGQLKGTLTPYFHVRDELTTQDGLVLKGDRIIVPESLRGVMKKKIHTSHIGIEGCLRRAREALYWPRMNAEIKEYISTCDVCRKHNPKQQQEPLKPHTICERPWQKVGTDLFQFDGRDYLLTIDYYSNFFEVDLL